MEQQFSGEQSASSADANEHMRILNTLPEYVMLLVLGQQPPPAWHSVEAHLAACRACRAEAEALQQLLRAAYTEALPAPIDLPPPDLSFLPQAFDLTRMQVVPPQKQRNQVRREPIHLPFSAALLAQIQVRRTVRAHTVRKRYEHTIPARRAQDPQVRIEIFERTNMTDYGQVRIAVEYPERNPFAQGGTQVLLQVGETTYSAYTNQHGVVLFTDIRLDQIDSWQLTVLPNEPDKTGS